MKPELRFEKKRMRVSDLGGESCLPDLLGEAIIQNELEFELNEEDEIYEGFGRRRNVFPYRQHNLYTRELHECEVQTAVPENDYIKAVFLPEFGGRLWELWDKSTGKNLLYTNDVIRFSNLAVRNAWFSGGVEWNIGVIGHCPFTADTLYTAKTVDEDGNPVLRMYEYERIRKVTFQMDFWLGEKDTALSCRMRIVNEGREVTPMYWWSNMAVPEHENGRVLVPADSAFTQRGGTVKKVEIPYVDGVDVTDYKKIPNSVDYFFDIAKDSPKYVANVDENGFGLLHISTQRLGSRKLFSWGSTDASDRWQEFLTEKGGRYLEIQAGLGKTQYGCIPMAPHTAWEWMEQYGAVQMPKEELKKPHKERCRYLTECLCEKDVFRKLEQKLRSTKTLSKKRAELIICGSGYGAFRKPGKGTEHLEFIGETEPLKRWQEFFDTGKLHEPSPETAPDEFLIEENSLEFLKNNMERNAGNWYAHYHLGIGYYGKEDYGKAAAAFSDSLEKAESVWALHGLSCAELMLGKKDDAAEKMLRAMKISGNRIACLKEGFRILSLCEAYGALCGFYETMGKELQQVSKLKFYYISALHELGRDAQAWELLNENGGLELEDIREGEKSLTRLWTELYKSFFGKEGQIPHRYNFRVD